jgi:hypothetical protein
MFKINVYYFHYNELIKVLTNMATMHNYVVRFGLLLVSTRTR